MVANSCQRRKTSDCLLRNAFNCYKCRHACHVPMDSIRRNSGALGSFDRKIKTKENVKGLADNKRPRWRVWFNFRRMLLRTPRRIFTRSLYLWITSFLSPLSKVFEIYMFLVLSLSTSRQIPLLIVPSLPLLLFSNGNIYIALGLWHIRKMYISKIKLASNNRRQLLNISEVYAYLPRQPVPLHGGIEVEIWLSQNNH